MLLVVELEVLVELDEVDVDVLVVLEVVELEVDVEEVEVLVDDELEVDEVVDEVVEVDELDVDVDELEEVELEVVVKLKFDFNRFAKRNSAISSRKFSYNALNSTRRPAALNGSDEDGYITAYRFYKSASSGNFEIPVRGTCRSSECSISIFVYIANSQTDCVSSLRLNLNPLPILCVGSASSRRSPSTIESKDAP